MSLKIFIKYLLLVIITFIGLPTPTRSITKGALAYTCDATSIISVNTAVTISDSTFDAVSGCQFISTNAVSVNDMTEVLKLLVATSSGDRGLLNFAATGVRFENVILSIDSSHLHLVSIANDRDIPLIVEISHSKFSFNRDKWTRCVTVTGDTLPPGSMISFVNNTFVGQGQRTSGLGVFGFVDMAVPDFAPQTLLLLANNSFYLSYGGYATMIQLVLSFNLDQIATGSQTLNVAEGSAVRFIGNTATILPYYSPGFSNTVVIVGLILNGMKINVVGSGKWEMRDCSLISSFTPAAGGYASFHVQGLYLIYPLSISNGAATLLHNISVHCIDANCGVFRAETSVVLLNRSSLRVNQCSLNISSTSPVASQWGLFFSVVSTAEMIVGGGSSIVVQQSCGHWRGIDASQQTGVTTFLFQIATFSNINLMSFKGLSTFQLIDNALTIELTSPPSALTGAVIVSRLFSVEVVASLPIEHSSFLVKNNLLLFNASHGATGGLNGGIAEVVAVTFRSVAASFINGTIHCSALTIDVIAKDFYSASAYGYSASDFSMLLQNGSSLSMTTSTVAVNTVGSNDYFNSTRQETSQACILLRFNQTTIVVEGNSSVFLVNNSLSLFAIGYGENTLVHIAYSTLRWGYLDKGLIDSSNMNVTHNNLHLEVGSAASSLKETNSNGLRGMALVGCPLTMGSGCSIDLSGNSFFADRIQAAVQMPSAQRSIHNVTWPIRTNFLSAYWYQGAACELYSNSFIRVYDNIIAVKPYLTVSETWVVLFSYWEILYPFTATVRDLRFMSNGRSPIPFVIHNNRMSLNLSLVDKHGLIYSTIFHFNSPSPAGPLFAVCQNFINEAPLLLVNLQSDDWISSPAPIVVHDGDGCSTLTSTPSKATRTESHIYSYSAIQSSSTFTISKSLISMKTGSLVPSLSSSRTRAISMSMSHSDDVTLSTLLRSGSHQSNTPPQSFSASPILSLTRGNSLSFSSVPRKTTTFADLITRSYSRLLPLTPKPPSDAEKIKEISEEVVGSVIGGGMGSLFPKTAVQAGTAMVALRWAKRCNEKTEDADGDEDEPLSPFVHPLRFGIGSGRNRFYLGAVIGNCLIIPLVAAIILWLCVPLLLQKCLLPNRPSRGDVLIFTGWPSTLVLIAPPLVEGTMSSSVNLLMSGNAEEPVVGIAAIGLVIAFLALWCYILRTRVCRYRTAMSRISDTFTVAGCFSPMYERVPDGVEPHQIADAERALVRWAQLFGSSYFLWSECLGFACGILVGIIEGLGERLSCGLGAWLLLGFAIIQSLVACTTCVPVEFTVQTVMGILLIIICSSAAHSVNSGEGYLSDDQVSNLGTVINVLSLFGIVIGLLEFGFVLVRLRIASLKLSDLGLQTGTPIWAVQRKANRVAEDMSLTNLLDQTVDEFDPMDRFLASIHFDVYQQRLAKDFADNARSNMAPLLEMSPRGDT